MLLLPYLGSAFDAYEADDASLSKCKLLTKHKGFNGAGYADFGGFGSHMSWDIFVPKAGKYKMSVRYASADTRPLKLLIDEITKGSFAFEKTNSWRSWSTESFIVFLNEGSHQVKLEATESKGPNIDRMLLESTGSYTTGTLGEKVYYQAEDARANNIKITSKHSGYQGTGYGDFGGFGASLQWDIQAPVAGSYEIAIRYASANSRPLELVIDGKPSGSFAIQGTSSWRSWYTEIIRVNLDQGTHVLKLLASSSAGPNVDWVYVQSQTISDPTNVPTKAPFASTPDAPTSTMAVYYQPQDATSNRVDILYDNRNYDGDNGYADYLGNGAFLLWSINLPVAGDYEVSARYSAKSTRSASLYFDDQVAHKFDFLATGSWHNWQVEPTILSNLSPGMHEFMLRADESSGPNIDWLSILPLSTSNPLDPTDSPVTARPSKSPVTQSPTKAPTRSPITMPPSRSPTTVAPTRLPTKAPETPSPIEQPTGPLGTVFYQPEDAEMNDIKIRKRHSGYDDGNGYADYLGRGAYLLWSISAPISANYEVTVRYAAKNKRPSFLLLDGTKVDKFAFAKTNSWRVWKKEKRTLYLEQGSHSLMVLAAKSIGPNLDWLSLRALSDKPSTQIPVTSSPTKSPTTSSPTKAPTTSKPTKAPSTQVPVTPSPTKAPTTSSPTKAPQPTGTGGLPPSDFREVVVLASRDYLSRGEFVSSFSGNFKVGLTNGGNFVLKDKNSKTIWSSGTNDGHRLYQQSDGNLILRTSSGSSSWKSRTYNNPGARFVLDDGGQISVIKGTDTVVWLEGIPRGSYTGPSSQNLQYPLRGIFYYPWYPETWTIGGSLAHYEPSIGYYSSSDPTVVESHLDSFEYAHIDVSIASWWGPETNLDRARLLMRMDRTIQTQSSVKWTVYYEDEMKYDPSINQIRADLAYLKKWFAWHPAWAHVDGKPVIFIWNESDCEVVERWMEASNGEWYVIAKLFGDYDECPVQPSHWHQYGVSNGSLAYRDVSFTIAPGFWKANESKPRFPRLSKRDFCENVEEMVDSGYPWQLIVSFNEAGEGTMIESSPSWGSNTKYGYYLDCLNKYRT